ncbi:MAG TPA: lasso peptide biosynthesis B2 protein [Gemmatimonadaceae bacterium]|jgi:hypothetical protein
MPQAASAPQPASTDGLEDWLLGRGALPQHDVLRRMRLAAYAYTVLLPSDPARPAFRDEYSAALGRHHLIKRELLPLLHAWYQARIDLLVFKGFQLAEFEDAAPGARFHGDVDILIPPKQIATAEHIARMLGWYQVAKPTAIPVFSHNAFALVRLEGAACVAVHTEIIHCSLPWRSVQRRITDAVWRASRVRAWEGIELREPSPVDMVLVALILQRCWSEEEWHLKPHDVIDFRRIVERHAIERAALEARARELGCERTLAIFLSRCDPQANRLCLAAPTRVERARWNLAAFEERGPLGALERLLVHAMIAPQGARLALAFVPTVWEVRNAMRRHNDLRALIRAVTPVQPAVDSWRPRADVVMGVRWAVRLVHGSHTTCLTRALAMYSALRQHGWPVTFVTGVRHRPEDHRLSAHAWVEYRGVVLPELYEPDNRLLFTENFRFPIG